MIINSQRMNQQLGNDAISEIRQSMRGLTGTFAKEMAVRLSVAHKVSVQHIYKLTVDFRQRQTRADKGTRKFEMVEGTDLWAAATLVIGGKLDPDQALLTAEKNGHTNLPSLEYFQKILREHGLGKAQRKSSKRPFRFWESEFPGEMYQIDVTALKVRWEDEKTRRILRIEGVDKNHPNPGDGKIRVWQIMAVDDHARRRFLRYVAATHITSFMMVQFKCELFNAWGVPLKCYTDNGSEFDRYSTRAAQILGKILENDGGYEHIKHAPGNSQASGKVEVAHQWAEKMDKYVGLAVAKGLKVTIDDLNPFADQICNFYNNRVHRATGQTPNARWFSKRIVVRKLPVEIIESALLSDEFTTTIQPSLTIEHKTVKYRVPGVQPYVDFAAAAKPVKVTVVVPPSIDLLLIKLPGEEKFREIEKVIATADRAGDFKSHSETVGQQLTKQLKEQFKTDNKASKQKLKTTGEVYQIPHYNVVIEQPATNVANFPHQERVISAAEVAAVVPISQSLLSAKEISYWEAVGMFADRFDDVDDAKEFFKTIYGDGEVIAETEIETAIANRQVNQQPARIYAVK